MSRSGTSFRAECAAWLKEHIGCQAVEFNVSVAGTRGRPAHSVDLRGERYGRRWQRSKSGGLTLFLTAVALQNVPPLFALAAEFSITPNRLLVLSLLLIALGHIGRIRTREYIWVQCKELARPVRRTDVETLDAAVGEVRNNETAKWKPAAVMLLTGAHGFEINALELARSVGIRCFRRTSASFEEALSNRANRNGAHR